MSLLKVLLDCDVLLDVALKRAPHFEASAEVLDWAELHPGRAALAWHTLSNLAYLTESNPRDFLKALLAFMRIPQVGHDQAEKALEIPMRDLEDAMQVTTAMAFGASCIITRNEKDYRNSPVPALTPRAFIQKMGG